MRIFEINDFLNRLNAFLLESFKEDMYRVYSKDEETHDEETDDEKIDDAVFDNAIKTFNNNQQVKNTIKKEIEPGGYLAGQIKKKYKTKKKFVDAISDLLDKFNKGVEKGKSKDYDGKNEVSQEYAEIQKAIKAGEEPDVDDKDFWVIPCRTYKQLHSVAQKYTGILPMLSRDEIQSEYDINVPEKASYYETSKTPEQFLEYMKNQTNFFMDPSWCIVKNEDFFDRYGLKARENEKPKCYVFISKKYPNVRFCLTLKNIDVVIKNIFCKERKIEFSFKYDINEVRDPWQIGGPDEKETGLQMMRLAFGKQKIDDVIKDISSPKTKMTPFSELKDGTYLFLDNSNDSFISASFDSLIDGYEMFRDSNFEKVNCKFPVLESAYDMFYCCKKLSEFTGELPKLSNGEHMFQGCFNLKKFECKNLSELENGRFMFTACESLEKFECNLPKVKKGYRMFSGCSNLTRFEGDLSSLSEGYGMFEYCVLDTESVKNIAETIAKSNGKIITIGVDEMDEEKEKYIKMIEEKGWKVEIE